MVFKSVNEVIGWCNLVIPTIFDDSLSYLEMVLKLRKVVNELVAATNQLGETSILQQEQIDYIKKQIEILEKRLDDFEKGYTIKDGTIEIRMFAKDTLEQLQAWVEESFNRVAKFVTFGLTDDGYFCAYIPESWKDVEFDTSENGELILRL